MGTRLRKTSTNVFRTDKISSLGACTHRPFVKVTRTQVKHHFKVPNRCFPSTAEPAAPPPPNSILGPPKHVFYSVSALGPSKTSCFLESGALWLQRPVLSRAWAVLAIRIVPKMTHRAPFCCTFWRVGSKVLFSLLFVVFSRGSDPRSARAGQSKRSFSFWAWPLKGYRFYNNYWNIPGTFGVGIP